MANNKKKKFLPPVRLMIHKPSGAKKAPMKEHHCHSFVHWCCELKTTKHAVLLVSNEEIIYHDCSLLPLKVSSFLSNDQESESFFHFFVQLCTVRTQKSYQFPDSFEVKSKLELITLDCD